MKFLERGIMLDLESGMNMDRGWEEVATALMYGRRVWAHCVMCEFIISLKILISNFTDRCAPTLSGGGDWTERGNDQKNPE